MKDVILIVFKKPRRCVRNKNSFSSSFSRYKEYEMLNRGPTDKVSFPISSITSPSRAMEALQTKAGRKLRQRAIYLDARIIPFPIVHPHRFSRKGSATARQGKARQAKGVVDGRSYC